MIRDCLKPGRGSLLRAAIRVFRNETDDNCIPRCSSNWWNDSFLVCRLPTREKMLANEPILPCSLVSLRQLFTFGCLVVARSRNRSHETMIPRQRHAEIYTKFPVSFSSSFGRRSHLRTSKDLWMNYRNIDEISIEIYIQLGNDRLFFFFFLFNLEFQETRHVSVCF